MKITQITSPARASPVPSPRTASTTNSTTQASDSSSIGTSV